MNDTELLLPHLRDLARRTFEGDYETSTGFLGLAEQAAFFTAQRKENPQRRDVFAGVPFLLWGGTPEAERRILVFLPSYQDPEGFWEREKTDASLIVPIAVRPRGPRFAEELTHRDFLGALMHLGITRDRIGDIAVRPDGSGAILFALRDICEVVTGELTRVRHTAVEASILANAAVDICPVFEERSGSVASERLDAVLALAFRLSRDKAKELVLRELVFVDGLPALSPDQALRPGVRVSARGFGKFVYDGPAATSKKGRLIVQLQMYK